MLHNQIYIGKLVWNATSSIKNPDTGRRIFRRTRAEDVITVDVPHMRIFPQDLWDRVHAVLAERRDAKGRHGPRVYKYANKDQLLVGLLTCGVCGGTMVIGQNNADGSPRVVCSYGHRRINCMHHRSYCLKTLEADVLDGVKHKLSYPRALLELTREYHARWAERQKQTKASRGDRVTIQIDRYAAAIGASDQMQVLVDKLKQLEIDRVSLTERLKLIDREHNVVTLHPKAIDEFQQDDAGSPRGPDQRRPRCHAARAFPRSLQKRLRAFRGSSNREATALQGGTLPTHSRHPWGQSPGNT